MNSILYWATVVAFISLIVIFYNKYMEVGNE
jgi:hypothetical protein